MTHLEALQISIKHILQMDFYNRIDLMHWRHISMTTTPCWGSRLVVLRAHVVLAERVGAQPLSQCAGPGQPGGMACRGWPFGCMHGSGARGSASFEPQHAGAPFCDVICIWSIPWKCHNSKAWSLEIRNKIEAQILISLLSKSISKSISRSF